MAEVKVIIKSVDAGSKEVKNFGQNLEGVLDVAKKSAVAVAAAGATFKKAFDLSKEGANLNQLTESFDRMNREVFKTPDLLDQMSAAARGTVKETDLMQGVLKLTAGASDELAARFASAAPRLLEIAKASNKLNPALGDTAFLYDSISTGIKRASPLILDNLGIVVKVGEANEKYAEQLGKSVAALTAEEKQVALLNATMEAGGQLIEQVGGDVASQADAWAQLTVMTQEATDAVKQYMGLQLQGVMGGAVNIIKGVRDAQNDLNTAVNLGIITEKQRAVIIGSLVSGNLRDYKEAVMLVSAAVDEHAEAALSAGQADRLFANYTQEATTAVTGLSQAAAAAAPPNEELADKFFQVAAQGSVAEQKIRAANLAMEQGKAAAEANAEAQAALAEQQRQLAAASGDYFNEALNVAGEQPTINQMLYEAADAAGADAMALAALAGATGEYTKEQINASLAAAAMQQKAQDLAAAIADGSMTVNEARSAMVSFQEQLNQPYKAVIDIEAAGALGKLESIIRKLNGIDGRTARATVDVNTPASIPTNFGGSGDKGGGAKGPGAQYGANFTVPPGYPNDTFPMRVSSGEHVQVTPAGQAGGGGPINIDLRGAFIGSQAEFNRMMNAALAQRGRRAEQLTRSR